MKIYTPSDNNGNNIFVFGSNEAGFHGAGAALEALRHWGAEKYVGFGLQGNSFAIPTKDKYINSLPYDKVKFYVECFTLFTYSKFWPKGKKALITKVGCGLAGFTDKQIAPLFGNIGCDHELPEGWIDLILDDRAKRLR